jgi:hypothetical protein
LSFSHDIPKVAPSVQLLKKTEQALKAGSIYFVLLLGNEFVN